MKRGGKNHALLTDLTPICTKPVSDQHNTEI